MFDETNLGNPTGVGIDTTRAKIQRASLAGTYAFGPAKVFAGYRYAHALSNARLPGGTLATVRSTPTCRTCTGWAWVTS